MKKKRAFLSIVMTLVMILTMLPFGEIVVYANGNTKINTIKLTGVGKPYPGMKPNLQALPVEAGYQVATDYNSSPYNKGVCWIDKTTNSFIYPDKDTFVEGHTYEVSIRVTAKSGYEFEVSGDSPNVTATVNSGSATAYRLYNVSAKEAVNIGYNFGICKKGVVSQVKITGLAEPKPDQTPSYTTTTNSAYYSVASVTNEYGRKNGIRWYDGTDKKNLTPGKDKFVAGHIYRCEIYVDANTGFKFSTTSDGYPNVSSTVNGSNADSIKISGEEASERFVIQYDFGECKNDVVSNVVITGVTAPKIGQKPTYSATMSESDKYSINTSYTGTNVKNGIYWWDKTDLKRIGFDDTFQAGHEYMVQVAVSANAGYEFSVKSTGVTSLTGTINGNTAKFYGIQNHDDKKDVVVDYTFEVLQNKICSSVLLNGITEPKAGQKPTYPNFSKPESFHVNTDFTGDKIKNGIYWWDKTDLRRLDFDDTFKAGHVYMVEIAVSAGEGYEFPVTSTGASAVTGTINGKEAKFYGIQYKDSKKDVVADLTFDELKNEVCTEVTLTGIIEPKVGEKPSYPDLSTSSECIVNKGFTGDKIKNGMYWWDKTDQKRVDFDDTFQAGHVYMVTIAITANEGYEFSVTSKGSPNLTGTVNGKEAKFYGIQNQDSKKDVVVDLTFDELKAEEISEVKVIGIVPPAHGEKATFLPSVVGKGYSINKDYTSPDSKHFKEGVRWMDLTAGGSVNTDNGTFIGGHTYRVDVMLTANPGYAFAVDSSNKILVAGTLNGENAEISGMAGFEHSSVVVVSYTFECASKIITSVAITGVTPPVAGQSPVYEAVTNSKDYSYKSNQNDDYGVHNGVCWADETEAEVFFYPDGKFVAGHSYNCEVVLVANEGCEFATDSDGNVAVTGTLNGNKAEPMDYVYYENKKGIIVHYSFGVCESSLSSYTVSFEANGGTGTMSDLTIEEGQNFTVPENTFTEPDDMTFDCWTYNEQPYYPNDTFTMPSSDVVFKAQWVPKESYISYPVAFDANGGEGEVADWDILEGEEITLPNCSFNAPYGKEFKCWQFGENTYRPGDKFVMPGQKVTFKAIWSNLVSGMFEITFDYNGHGTGSTSTKVAYQSVVVKPSDPTDDDYKFEGWYTEKECINEYDFSTPVTKEITLYAKWTKKEQTPDKPKKLMGDVDGDNDITSADSLLILRQSVGLEKFDEETLKLCDVDQDGDITSADALEVLRVSVGLSTTSLAGKTV